MNKESTISYKLCANNAQFAEKEKITREPISAYALSRKNANMTQEEAAGKIYISRRQLAQYESCKAKVPDEVVDKMVQVYGAPELAWWHLKYFSILGRYLPDVPEPQTNGDLMFQMYSTGDRWHETERLLKKIIRDGNGSMSEADAQNYRACIENLKIISATTYVMALYGENIKSAN